MTGEIVWPLRVRRMSVDVGGDPPVAGGAVSDADGAGDDEQSPGEQRQWVNGAGRYTRAAVEEAGDGQADEPHACAGSQPGKVGAFVGEMVAGVGVSTRRGLVTAHRIRPWSSSGGAWR